MERNTAEATYFRLLGSLLYNEPDLATISMLKNEGLFEELPFAEDDAQVKKGQEQMTKWLASKPVEELVEDARVEYMRLLLGVGKPLACPWGSVYISTDKLLFTEETLHVRLFYEKYGVMIEKKHSEPDDHIGLELGFLATLAEKGESAARNEFIEKYMLPWIEEWNQDVQKHSRIGFYNGLANMAVGGVKHCLTEGNRD